MDHNKLWKILKDVRIPDHLTCLLHVGQEAAVRTLHGTTDWFKNGRGVGHRCIFLSCLFNFYPDYTVQNAGLDGIKIAGKIITNFIYAGDTTLMAESKEELKSLLMRVKEERKSWLKAQHKKKKQPGSWHLVTQLHGK